MSESIILKDIDPRLNEILKDTYYQLIYQEQVMIICMKLAGYSLGQADKVRKTIGRKIQSELDEMIPDLYQKFKDNGVPEKGARDLAKAIEICGGYGFNKCLAGSEVIMRIGGKSSSYTIEQMYNIMHDKKYAKQFASKSLYEKYNRGELGRSYSIDEDNVVWKNRIKSIEFSGYRVVYKITTKSGRSVRCTDNHKFPLLDGTTKLVKDLTIGDKLLILQKDKPLNYGYLIGEGTNLPVKGQQGFQHKKHSVSNIFESYRALCREEERPCEVCGYEYNGVKRFELHHIDLNRSNSDLNNLQWLCVNCHKKVHYKIGRKVMGGARRIVIEDEIISISQDGYENTYSVEMYDPFHNFTLDNGIITCNSHAVEYGLISYQTAYLKANYPLQYMCSLLNGNIDSEDDIIRYINECKSMGINILPPSVKVGNLRFIPEDGNIRMGLSYIKGINKLEYTYYKSLELFFTENKFNKRIKEALIKSGALDCFGVSRKDMLCMSMNIKEEIANVQNKIQVCKDKIISKNNEISLSKQGTKKVSTLHNQIANLQKSIEKYEGEINTLKSYGADYDEVQGEIDTLGFTFQDRFTGYDTSYAIYNKDIQGYQTFICEVTDFKKHIDKNGNTMAFVQATPYMNKSCDFVMLARQYKELDNGIYLMKVQKGNIIVDVAKAIKR